MKEGFTDSLICLPGSKDHGFHVVMSQSTFRFLDDVLVVSKGTEDEPFEIVSY